MYIYAGKTYAMCLGRLSMRKEQLQDNNNVRLQSNMHHKLQQQQQSVRDGKVHLSMVLNHWLPSPPPRTKTLSLQVSAAAKDLALSKVGRRPQCWE